MNEGDLSPLCPVLTWSLLLWPHNDGWSCTFSLLHPLHCLSADWPKQEIVQWTNYVENFRRCSISFLVDMDCLLQKTNTERRLASQSKHVLKLIKFIWSIYKRVDLQNLPRKRKKTHSLLHPFLWHFLWLHYTAIFYYFSS